MNVSGNDARGAWRRVLGTVAALAAAWGLSTGGALAAGVSGEPVVIGVSGPLTGQDAQYGEQWKRGFDLALDEINGSGGIHGRPLAVDFQDSRSDPRQAVAIAQKFVADPRIAIELGDFSSATSMAASPIYQRGQLTQFGFTNSHPDFTKGGDYLWSTALSQAEEQPLLARYAVKELGFKRIAVLYLNTDWGRTSKDIFAKAVAGLGAQVVAAEGYQPTEKDFRSTLVRIGESKPDSIVLISYYADGAQIVRHAADRGGWLRVFAEIPRAGRRGRRWRLYGIELLPGGTAPRGAGVRAALSREIPCRSRFVRRACVRRADPVGRGAAPLRHDTPGRARRLRENQRRAERDLRQGTLRSADAPRRGRTHRVSGREAGAVGAMGWREAAARRALTPALNSTHVTDAS
ncbi:branched-chain amino acid transport system substrate-binding protein [Burkholderia ambifaria]